VGRPVRGSLNFATEAVIRDHDHEIIGQSNLSEQADPNQLVE
jgi:hypothetical protein